MLSCALFIDALSSPTAIGLTFWLLFVMTNCEVVTFPLVAWVRCGAWLYRLMIVALFLTCICPFLMLSFIYDKRDVVKTPPFLDGDVPRSTSYGVYISQLIRFARASSHVAGFNTLNKAIHIINVAKPFLNCIAYTVFWYLNSMLDFNLSYAKDFQNLSSIPVFEENCWHWYFSAQFIKNYFSLMYCNRLHAWWSTQSRLVILFTSLIARQWVELQTLWRFWLKDLSVDEMVGSDALAVVMHTRVDMLDFFCSSIQFYVQLSTYLCFISFPYLGYLF